MKIKEGFVLRPVGGDNVVVPLGAAAESFHGMVRLNDTGAFLWKRLQELGEASEDELADALVSEYGIDKARATSDVHDFAQTLLSAGVFE